MPPDPGQVTLCAVSPLQGREAFISSATPQPGPGAAPGGLGLPTRTLAGSTRALLAPRHPHTRCLGAAWGPLWAGRNPLPTGMRVGLGEP